MSDTMPAASATPETKELAVLVQQATAPDLAIITEAGGLGALVAVQAPDQLVPVRPKHVDDPRDLEIIEEAQRFVQRVQNRSQRLETGGLYIQARRKHHGKDQNPGLSL